MLPRPSLYSIGLDLVVLHAHAAACALAATWIWQLSALLPITLWRLRCMYRHPLTVVLLLPVQDDEMRRMTKSLFRQKTGELLRVVEPVASVRSAGAANHDVLLLVSLAIHLRCPLAPPTRARSWRR